MMWKTDTTSVTISASPFEHHPPKHKALRPHSASNITTALFLFSVPSATGLQAPPDIVTPSTEYHEEMKNGFIQLPCRHVSVEAHSTVSTGSTASCRSPPLPPRRHIIINSQNKCPAGFPRHCFITTMPATYSPVAQMPVAAPRFTTPPCLQRCFADMFSCASMLPGRF